MSVTPYATLADLGAYLGTEPDPDSQRLLARAQELIDDALTSAAYAVDVDGNPTDAIVIAALNKATCQQVEFWLTTGDEFGQLRKLRSYSIEGISVTQDPGPADISELCPRARATLRAVTPGSGRLVPGVVTTT